MSWRPRRITDHRVAPSHRRVNGQGRWYYLADGRALAGTTRELSLGGSSIVVPRPDDVADTTSLLIEVPVGTGTVILPAIVQRWQARFLQVAFKPATVTDESNIVQAVFGRADAWV